MRVGTHETDEGTVDCARLRHREQVVDQLLAESAVVQRDGGGHHLTDIVGPDGAILAGPARQEETILYADIDPAAVRAARRFFDRSATTTGRTSSSFTSTPAVDPP